MEKMFQSYVNFINGPDKEKLGSNKIRKDIFSRIVGLDKAREVFGAIFCVYYMRVGDAHSAISKTGDALELTGIRRNRSRCVIPTPVRATSS